ncbi:bacteriocin fulvocin C-related protein [Streptomyces sp. NPDC057403]|uniref:bacteriocin fulvocin C-related protein n=1 Tax=Streptomyces sp. NPDC057403 TaxID=3346119 RepID=UPI0036B5895B
MLAFDASCAACRAVSSIVFNACDGRLEVVALGRADVTAWRERALGPDAPWAPSLLAVEPADDDASHSSVPDTDARPVRAWTGASMALPLLRRLGPRAALRVLRALGEARGERPTDIRTGPGRAQFLRLAGGLAVASTILVKGGTPAFAEGKDVTAAKTWVDAHAGRLPTRYADVTALPLAHRRAVHAALPVAARSRLWVEHIDRFRAAHPDLTARQVGVVERARATAADVSTFQRRPGPGTGRSDLAEAAVSALGEAKAAQLLAHLGPVEAQGLPNCECSALSNFCFRPSHCVGVSGSVCEFSDGGCGEWWIWDCDGMCYG